MGLIKEFKAFIAKGNVIDLAVAVVIGGAFGKIVTSFIEDIITPLLLTPALKAAKVDKIENWAPGGIYWGKFLNAILTFLVIAFVIFLMVKALNKLKKEEAAAPPAAPTTTEKLLMEIRDSLKK
ncbi:MAG: large conductance mechanosensitive channel protein MscL [Chitinophagaceae bacterium]|nr:MAG: large conductance mechanosensitive channel protein MscL [Chitinophagaceae bacterium]